MNQQPEKKIYAPGNCKLWCKNPESVNHIIGICRDAPPGEKVIFKLGLYADEFVAFINEHKNEKGFININMTVRREDGKFGDQFTLWLDTWKPSAPQQPSTPRAPYQARPSAPKPAVKKSPIPEDDIPWE